MPPTRFTVLVDGCPVTVDLEEDAGGRLRVRVDGAPVEVDGRVPQAGPASLLVDGGSHLVDFVEERDGLRVWVDGEAFEVRVEDLARRSPAPGGRAGPAAGQRLRAPMPGKVVAVLVEAGQAVEPGAGLVVLEAMKMENEFRATVAGTVTEVHVTPGQTVNTGDLLVVVA
jgi:biotin carboxyl carrier protein